MTTYPYLLVKVGPSELQRVEEGVGGSQLNVVAGLFLPHALNDGGEDLVGIVLQLLRVLMNKKVAIDQTILSNFTVLAANYSFIL